MSGDNLHQNGPNGPNDHQKSARYASVMSRLKEMAQPVRSSSYKHLALSKLKSKQTEVPESVTVANGKNPDELASWMSSITRRARAALFNDDRLEIETEKQIAKITFSNSSLEEEEDYLPESSAFDTLGEILSKRKRPQDSSFDSQKKQKVFFFFSITIHFILCLYSNIYNNRLHHQAIRKACL